MGLKIEKEEFTNRTFRINLKLLERMEKVCESKNISLNKLFVLCTEFALNNLEDEENKSKIQPKKRK